MIIAMVGSVESPVSLGKKTQHHWPYLTSPERTSSATSGDPPASTHSSTLPGSQGTNGGDDEISVRGSSEDDAVGSESGTRSRHSTNSLEATSMELVCVKYAVSKLQIYRSTKIATSSTLF